LKFKAKGHATLHLNI